MVCFIRAIPTWSECCENIATIDRESHGNCSLAITEVTGKYRIGSEILSQRHFPAAILCK